MTIGSIDIQTSGSAGNGATVTFSFSFNLDPDGYGDTSAASQVQVIRELISTGAEETLTLTTDYSVSVNADQAASPGGSITMVSAPSSSYKIWIRLNPDFTQQTDYQNQGGFLMETVEDQADQTTRQILWLRDQVRKAPRVGVQAGASFNGEITGDVTPNYIPAVNPSGTGFRLVANNGSSNIVTATGSTEGRSLADWMADIAELDGTPISAAMASVVQAASLVTARDLLGISPLDVRPEAYGAEGDGVTNDTTAMNAAIAAAAALGTHARVYLYATYLVTSITNTYGVEFYGPGKIAKAITGGNQQLNSYADEGNRIFIGKEYLTRAYQFLAGGQGSPTYTLDCFIYGDSTIEGGYGEGSLGVEDVLRLFAAARGIPNISFTNRGAVSTSVDDINAIPDLGADTGLIFIKYGINDASDGLATFTTNLRTELAAIRADSDGAEGSLSIVLVGPNSTNDTPNGRDEEWYEQLRGVYVQAARDYKCAFFDTYAYMRDSRSAAGKWLDNPYADGRGVHPLGNGNLWIWGAVFDACFSDSEVVAWKTNKVINHGATTHTLAASVAPSAFAQCAVSIDRATVANGFPYEGSVVTFWSVDGPVVQVLYPYAQHNTRISVRTAYVVGDSWNRWSGVKENLTLGYNSWVDAALGGGFPAPGAFIDASGVVRLVGGVKSGTTTAGTQIAQLPSGMAPAYNQIFPVAANGGIVQIKVQTNGGIYLQTTGDASFTMLDGISFLSA